MVTSSPWRLCRPLRTAQECTPPHPSHIGLGRGLFMARKLVDYYCKASRSHRRSEYVFSSNYKLLAQRYYLPFSNIPYVEHHSFCWWIFKTFIYDILLHKDSKIFPICIKWYKVKFVTYIPNKKTNTQTLLLKIFKINIITENIPNKHHYRKYSK